MTHDDPNETPPGAVGSDAAILAAQERLRSRRQEAQEGDRSAVDGAQAILDAHRARVGVQRAAPSVPWLRVVRALDAHAASPETVAAIARDNARLDAIARRALVSLAQRFELPDDPELTEVILSDAPRETAALAAFREVFEIRAREPKRRPMARVLSGPPGTGKTLAMAWAVLHQRHDLPLRQMVDALAPALFVTASTVAATPRNGFSTNADAWKRWVEIPVLAVDDAGRERGDAGLLVELFEERWAGTRITLVSTNVDKADWYQRYPSSRLADRWHRDQHARGIAWFMPVVGASMRGGR
jgi:hypothetical protein